MTTRLYKINGVYNTWQYWHDSCGYSESPSQPTSFKRSDGEHWGENAGDGYALNSDGELSQWSMWSDGIIGWFDANDLAEQGAYPASSADLFVERTGEKAKAVSLDDGTNTYYLIDGYLDLGWRLWEVLEAEGWQISSGGELAYIIVDEDTGEIVFSQNDPGMEFAEVGMLLMPDSEMILVYETGVRTESFYFTTNGRNETQNTNISWKDIPVYFEDGTAPAADTPYNGSSVLAFMDVMGNTKQADGESLYVDSGVLRLDAPDTDEGEQWAALVEYIEVVLKVKWGDTVNVPSGYKVSEVRTFVGYAFKSYFGDFSGDSSKIVAFPGKNVYFDNIPSHKMLSSRTYSNDPASKWPLVEVFQTTDQHLVGKYLTVGYKNAIPEWATQDRSTNGTDSTAGEYSVYLRGNNTTAIINAINSSYPVRYLWFIIDDQGNACWWKSPEAFRVPHDLWSFSHGTFSWLGNSEDITSLAWWYKHDWELFEWEEFDGAWIYIHCVRDENPEPPAPSELTAYFTSSGANNRDTDVGRNSFYYLYDENGQRILYDTSKTYTITGVYKVDGTKLETSTSDFIQASSLGELMWFSNVLPSTGTWYYAYKLTYTET